MPMPTAPPDPAAAPGSAAPLGAAPRNASRLPVVGETPAGPVGQVAAPVVRLDGAATRHDDDLLAAEEPLEIRMAAGGVERIVAVTMRTPGHDAELAAGFLYAEGVIADRREVRRLTDCLDDGAVAGGSACDNRLWVELAADHMPDLAPLERHFFATSACGVCGKAGLEALAIAGRDRLPVEWTVDRRVLAMLPDRLRDAQGLFAATGGLHAAARFTPDGELVAVREDVGRHNALDKLVGRAFLDGELPLSRSIVLVSGRSSFEILQKCLAAEVPVVCSVSAPSSLAVEVARRFGITLVGFLRGERANVYSVPERVAGLSARAATPATPRATTPAGL
jgi:FdhD protein